MPNDHDTAADGHLPKGSKSDNLISLQEFCEMQSNTGHLVELLSGFHYQQSSQGKVKDSLQNYQERFADFAGTPVSTGKGV
jgi:hypothetical protein